MGLLTVGKPYRWDESGPYRNYVREHGVIQFLNAWKRHRDTCCDDLLWGDEVEYGIFKIDHEAKTVKLSLRGSEIMEQLRSNELAEQHRCEGCQWHPEYGAWMVEATPRGPFTGYASDLLRVERNMRLRRKRLLSVLQEDEIAPTVTCFPLMGVGDFTVPPLSPGGPVAESQYVPDAIINAHPRFAALTRNIRLRRRANVDIRLPLFHDQKTPEFSSDAPLTPHAPLPPPPLTTTATSPLTPPEGSDDSPRFSSAPEKASENGVSAAALVGAAAAAAGETNGKPGREGRGAAEAPVVHMDAMAFGMGCCCLQVTFQATDIDESRFIYDQLAVLAPVMLALTAATPIMRGRLVDTDVRWGVIAASVDDRNDAERGEATSAEEVERLRDPQSAGEAVRRLHKSRYDSISSYLHYCKRREDPMFVVEKYSDIPCEVDEPTRKYLIDNGIDEALAMHIAHLFVRDPLVIFAGATSEVNDETETEHFENIQSTNWQTVRWKPPPPPVHPNDPHIGWRAEFRSMEVNLTDAENAAFTVFVVLVTRVILAFDLNLYVPLSKVDENLRRAHIRDAVTTQRFFWRQHMAPPDTANEDEENNANEADSSSGSDSGGRVGSSMNGPPVVVNSGGSSGGAAAAKNGPNVVVVSGSGSGGVGEEAVGEPGQSGKEKSGGSAGAGGHSHEHEAAHSHEHETAHDGVHKSCDHEATGFEEMTIEQIMMGKGSYYPGLIPLVYAYLEHIGCDAETTARVHEYMELVRRRAAGELPTTATWMRNFVQKHPAYRADSVVPQETAYDLLLECRAIGEGRRRAPELLGDIYIRPITPHSSYDVKLSSSLVSSRRRRQLVSKYRNRRQWDERGRSDSGVRPSSGSSWQDGASGEAAQLRALRAQAGGWLNRESSLSYMC